MAALFNNEVQCFVTSVALASLNASGILSLTMNWTAGDGVGVSQTGVSTATVKISDGIETWYPTMTQAIVNSAQILGITLDPTHVILPMWIRGSV